MPDLKLMYAPTSEKSHGYVDQLIEKISKGEITLETGVHAFEKKAIEKTIATTYTISETAKKLGISRSNLDLKRKKYSIGKN